METNHNFFNGETVLTFLIQHNIVKAIHNINEWNNNNNNNTDYNSILNKRNWLFIRKKYYSYI